MLTVMREKKLVVMADRENERESFIGTDTCWLDKKWKVLWDQLRKTKWQRILFIGYQCADFIDAEPKPTAELPVLNWYRCYRKYFCFTIWTWLRHTFAIALFQ